MTQWKSRSEQELVCISFFGVILFLFSQQLIVRIYGCDTSQRIDQIDVSQAYHQQWNRNPQHPRAICPPCCGHERDDQDASNSSNESPAPPNIPFPLYFWLIRLHSMGIDRPAYLLFCRRPSPFLAQGLFRGLNER